MTSLLLALALLSAEPDRSPVDLVVSLDGRWLVTANQTSNTVSLVERSTGLVSRELACDARPTAIALAADGRTVLVTACDAGTLLLYELADDELRATATIAVGERPHGVAVSRDGQMAYVALETADRVAVVDLRARQVVETIAVGRWPRYLALSPDESRLAVGLCGDLSVAVVDVPTRKVLYRESVEGINLGHMQISRDGRYVYFPYMVYRLNPITAVNIRLGWVLGTRIGRVRLDGPARREAITLDERGLAMSDPHGIAISADEQWLVATSSGTHELLVYRLADLPWQAHGGPGDHIDPALHGDRERFDRVALDGRPMGCRFVGDSHELVVANYLSNRVQTVDVDRREVLQQAELGGPPEPSLARRGEAIFYDARRSLDQWYSCHSCHYEGGPNAVAMDTHNDRSDYTFKTVPALANVARTGPWTWHGWQQDLGDACRVSIRETMLGPEPTDDDVAALVAWLEELSAPPNPHRTADGALSEAAERGRRVFVGAKAACASCHREPTFTDGQVHDVGTGSERDKLDGYNTPSLVGLYRKTRLMHDGRARSLEAVLETHHRPETVAGDGTPLDEAEQHDLIEYLRSL